MTRRNDKRNNRRNRQRNNTPELPPFAQMLFGAIVGKGVDMIAKKMAEWGIKGFWNFAPIDLHLPDNVTVENVHLAESLMTLTYNVHNREEQEQEQ